MACFIMLKVVPRSPISSRFSSSTSPPEKSYAAIRRASSESVCTGTAMDEVISRLTLRITIIMKSVTFSRRKGIRRRAGSRFV